MGAVFRVGGAGALLGVRLAELRDRRVPHAELWGSVASELLERPLAASSAEAKLDALDQVLSARLGQIADRPHPVAGRAAAQIARYPERCRIAELAEGLGLSARRLEQVFGAEVGLTPKAYQRLHRFRQALVGIDRAAEIGWARFALGAATTTNRISSGSSAHTQDSRPRSTSPRGEPSSTSPSTARRPQGRTPR
jgi:AraC-like DNA-binding protein